MANTDKPAFPVKLTRGRFLYGSPSWVSNGVLAVRRDLISNEALFAPRVAQLALGAEEYKDKDDSYFDHLAPLGLTVRQLNRSELGFIGTGPGTNSVLFRDGARHHEMVLVSEEAVRGFGLYLLFRYDQAGLLVRGEIDMESRLIHADMLIAPVTVEGSVWRSLTDVAQHVDALKGTLELELASRARMSHFEQRAKDIAADAVEALAPKPGSEVESVTLEVVGKPETKVTLTQADGERARKARGKKANP